MTPPLPPWLAPAAASVAIAAAVVALLLRAASALAAPLDEPGVLDRVGLAYLDASDAADATDLDPTLVLAVALVESRLLPVVGGYQDRHFGPGQVAWWAWGAELVQAGVVDGRDDLLRLREGLAATAWVLRYLLDRWHRGGATTLCTYNQGNRGLRMPRCPYSDAVLAVRAQLRARLAGHDAVAVGTQIGGAR
jgi:hypothetical protein